MDLPEWAAKAQTRAECGPCELNHYKSDGPVPAVALVEALNADGTTGNLRFVCEAHLKQTARRRARILDRKARA